METSDAHGDLFHSKVDRLHTCFTKWHALKLVKNDTMWITLQCPDESSELPAPAAMKQGFTSHKRGTKMKDRYLYAVLLVGQVCREAPPGKDDDVADHPSESHNLAFEVMGVIMESIRSSPNDCREKGHARKDCSKFSAWLPRCKRCKTEEASDTGKLECASNWLGGQGSTTTGGEEALHKVTAIDSGMPPRLRLRSQEQGNEWQPSNTWRTILDRSSLPPPVGMMSEGYSFDAQRMGSIIGMMIADEKNDWSLSPCYVCRLVSPSGRLHNEDALSDGSYFSTFGKDETVKLPDNTKREHWDTHMDGIRMESATASRASSRWL